MTPVLFPNVAWGASDPAPPHVDLSECAPSSVGCCAVSVVPPGSAWERTARAHEERHPGRPAFVPCARLFAENVIVGVRRGLGTAYEEMLVPLVALSFDYGGVHVP